MIANLLFILFLLTTFFCTIFQFVFNTTGSDVYLLFLSGISEFYPSFSSSLMDNQIHGVQEVPAMIENNFLTQVMEE